MKAGIFVAAAGLVQIAAAQPHHHAHQHAHEKRQVYVTDVTYATVTAAGPDVVVYVDAAGNPVTTSTIGGSTPTQAPAVVDAPPPAETSAAAVQSSVSSVVVQVAPVVIPEAQSTTATPAPATTQAPATTEAPAPAPTTTAAPAPATTQQASKQKSTSAASPDWPSGAGLAGTGIVYNAYNADGTCKTQAQVNTDFDVLGPKGYGLVRIYGTDCDQVSTVSAAVKQYNMKLFAGIYDINQVQSECDIIIAAAKGDFSYIDTISVGNELVNNGEASAGQVVAALNQARGIMNAAGYSGNMVIVDTFNAVIANPSICENSDYAAVNAHPFFDSSILAGAAGLWAVGTAALVKIACGGKRTIITETGMPWGGTCNGLMCPSPANQAAAISSLHSSMPDGGFIILSAFNDLWKQDAASTFFAEQSWGIYGDAPTS